MPYMYYEQIGKEIRDISDEIPFEIPEGWEWCRWGELSQSIQYGYNAPAKQAGRIKMVRISDIQDNKVLWDSVPYCDIEESNIDTYLLQANDILFARTGGTVGKSYLVKIVPEEAIYAGYLIRTRYSKFLCPEYLKFFMESELYWTQLRNGTIATAQPNCNGKTLSNMIVPVPPIEEQYRIVSKTEELLPYIEQYEKAETQLTQLNTTFPEMLKKSILQEAVQGKLVPQNPDDEPASVLLERIRAEKQALIKAGKIKKDKHESVIVTRDKIPYEIRDGKERCIADEVPFEIPENWCWCRLKNLVSILGDGIHGTPEYSEFGEYYFINGNNLSEGSIIIKDDTKKVDESQFIKYKKELNENTMFVSINGTIGNIAFYSNEKVILGKSACYFNLIIQEMKQYFFWLLKTDYFLKYAITNATGSTIKNVSLKTMNDFYVPLPPLEEQKRIVTKIEELMPFITAISK